MVIRNGWKHTTIGDMIQEKEVSIQTGPFGTVLSASDYIKHGIPVISVREIRQGYIELFEETPSVSKETYKKMQQFQLFPFDLVFARKGNVERSALIPDNGKCYFLGSDGIRLRFKNPTIPQILLYSFQSNEIKQYLTKSAYGTTMAGLNESIISQIPVSFPLEEKEQLSIAETLFDIDEQTRRLEKLIAKKKAIKQGATEQLLTGKTRLPGFERAWHPFNLMKNSKIKARIGWQGLKKSEYLDSGYAFLVTGTDFNNGVICWDSCHYVDKTRFDIDPNIQLKNDDILLTKDGSLGKTAIVQGLNKPATLNSGVFVIRPLNEKYQPKFVYYVLSSFLFDEFLDKLSAGSTIVHLYQKDLDKFSFLMPPTIDEQIAIATALSNMDSEIESLEERLRKTRQIKQGMMQQLLTQLSHK